MTNNYPENMNMDELMMRKSFSQLSEEEKSFVLEMLNSETEYEEMRGLVMNIKNSFDTEEDLVPDEKIKSSLMQAFEAKHAKNGKIVALNKNKNILRSPIFQIAAVGLIVIVISVLLFNNLLTQKDEIAQLTEKTDKVNDIPSSPLEEKALESTYIKPNLDTTTQLIKSERDKSFSMIENAEPSSIVNETKPANTGAARMDNDILVLDDLPDKENYKSKEQAGTTHKKEELSYSSSELSKAKKDSAKDTSNTNYKIANSAPAPASTRPNSKHLEEEAITTEKNNLSKRAESKDAKKELKNPLSLSLGEKPELMEFLFTAL